MSEKLSIPRLSVEEMRELVKSRLENKILFSDEVEDSCLGMVFMPILFGAFSVPPEILDKVLGPRPESLPGEPPKPVPPGHIPFNEDPPTKPTLAVIPDKTRLNMEFGYLSDEEAEQIKAEVEALNKEKIKAWEKDTWIWQDKIEANQKKNQELHQEYLKKLQEWEDSLSKHEEDVKERKDLLEKWQDGAKNLHTEYFADVGVLVGNYKDSFQRSINGYPIFGAFKFIHKEDWERIRNALNREISRQKEIEV